MKLKSVGRFGRAEGNAYVKSDLSSCLKELTLSFNSIDNTPVRQLEIVLGFISQCANTTHY